MAHDLNLAEEQHRQALAAAVAEHLPKRKLWCHSQLADVLEARLAELNPAHPLLVQASELVGAVA